MKKYSIKSMYQGRVNRTEYALGVLLAPLLAIMVGVSLFTDFPSSTPLAIIVILILIIYVGCFIAFIFSLHVRRLHDIGYNGWLSLLLPIPVIGGIFFIYICVKKGIPDTNEYGEIPQKRNLIKAVFSINSEK